MVSVHTRPASVFDCIQHSLAVKEESWMNRCWDSASTVHVTIEGSALPITHTASASQNVTKDVLHKKPEEWLPCLAHKLKHSNEVTDWWSLNKTISIDKERY